MSRGRLLAIAVLLLTGLGAVPASAAEPPDCQIRYAQNDVLELRDSKPVDIRLDCGWLAEDYDFAVTSPPQHGSLAAATWDGDLHEHVMTYDPVDAYVGPDQFTLTVSVEGESTPVVVMVDVVSNTAPACGRPDSRYAHTGVEAPHTESITCVDVDLQDMELAPELKVAPAHGEVEFSIETGPAGIALSMTYTPESGFTGSDRFVAGLSDGDLADHVEFRVNVADGPWCAPFEPYEIRAGKTGTFGAFCTQPDGASGPLRVRVVDGPLQGIATPDAAWGSIEYTPFPSASGPDSFSYEAYSPAGVSNLVWQEWTILANSAPTCEGISTTVPAETSAAMSLVCADEDEDPVDLAIASAPTHGSLSGIAGGQVTYTPEPGFAGVDTFTYLGSDYARTSAPATVRIVVDDGKAPVLILGVGRQKPRQVARRGLDLSATSDETVTGRVRVTASGRTAKRLGLVRRAAGPVQIGYLRAELEGGVPAEIRLALRPRAAKAIRTTRRVPITVRLRGVDPLGDATQVTRRVTLRR